MTHSFPTRRSSKPASVHRPRLLVGDEPLSALDVTVRAQILRLLTELRERTGLTLLMVSHDIGVVQNLCDQVVVMKDGRIVEEGRTEKVLLQPQAAYTRALLSSIPTIRRSEEHTSELQSLMRISYAVFCLKKKKIKQKEAK